MSVYSSYVYVLCSASVAFVSIVQSTFVHISVLGIVEYIRTCMCGSQNGQEHFSKVTVCG